MGVLRGRRRPFSGAQEGFLSPSSPWAWDGSGLSEGCLWESLDVLANNTHSISTSHVKAGCLESLWGFYGAVESPESSGHVCHFLGSLLQSLRAFSIVLE